MPHPWDLKMKMIARGLLESDETSRRDFDHDDDAFISDDEALAGLRGITDPDDLWQALECLPESQCERMISLLKAS
jgi:hypothetical protein